MAIVESGDLPAAVANNELATLLLAGANSRAARVAPCLTDPTSTAWAATTAYAVGDKVRLAVGQFLEATVAGTSSGAQPVAPVLAETVVDGTVSWKRIAPTTDQLDEAKLVLVGAIKRWAEAGSGAYQQQTAGPFGVTTDTRQRSGFNLWPSEIEQLQDVCAQGSTSSSGAFSIIPGGATSTHLPWCSLNLGATYCSCGADIAGFPLFGA